MLKKLLIVGLVTSLGAQDFTNLRDNQKVYIEGKYQSHFCKKVDKGIGGYCQVTVTTPKRNLNLMLGTTSESTLKSYSKGQFVIYNCQYNEKTRLFEDCY